MVLLHAIESVLTIIIIFMVGYAMTSAGWVDKKAGDLFSRITLNVALPCYMFWNISADFSKHKLIELSSGLAVPFLTVGLCYLLSILVSNLIKVKKGRKGVYRSIFFTSNTIYIGLAVNIALFGEKSVVYALLYYIANTLFFWTFGVYEINQDGQDEEKVSLFSKDALGKILSPPLLGFITAVILILLNVHVPVFLLDSCRYIGQLATPLGLFFTGIILYSMKLKDLHIDKDIITLILARFVVCPGIVILLAHVFHLPALMAQVFIIQAAMPAMTATGVVAKEYGADYEFGTAVTVITTILSMIAIPVYMYII